MITKCDLMGFVGTWLQARVPKKSPTLVKTINPFDTALLAKLQLVVKIEQFLYKYLVLDLEN